MIVNLTDYDCGVLFGSFIGAGVGATVALMVWFILEFFHVVIRLVWEERD